MNYDGHEALRRDMAGLANNLCDLKTTLKVLEDTYHYRYDGLAERLSIPQRPSKSRSALA